jgi:hypothetical protein
MLTGKRFRVLDSIAALDGTGGSGWISIPAGMIIEVVSGLHGDGDRLIELRWEGRIVTMFAGELVRCAEIKPEQYLNVAYYPHT